MPGRIKSAVEENRGRRRKREMRREEERERQRPVASGRRGGTKKRERII